MADFDWTNYLETIKGTAVPEELFLHVEASLDNGIKKGMLLEVCHKNNPDMYWIAQITIVCGHLLRIKFIGATSDFWCDISTAKVHPLGWCGKCDELVEPPEEINEKYGHAIIEIMQKAIVDGQSVAIEALANKGLSPIDRIKVGMKVEVQNILDPYKYWIATVCENVGGRLLLRYDGADEDLPPIWIFFSNQRLSSFGYVTNKGSPWQFKYPGKVNKFSCKIKLSTQLRLSAEESIKEPTPPDLFQPIHNMKAHSFVVGMKLEALCPHDMSTIRPATVAKVFNNYHFLVAIDDYLDDYDDKSAWLCDEDHPYIYPTGWAARNNFTIKPPKIWKEGPFDWDVYLTMTSSTRAPEYCFGKKTPLEGLELNMHLEAVNPNNHEEIHVASIEAITEHMVCVELQPIGKKFWYSQDSDMLLPVGWCDSNSYALHIPDLTAKKQPEVKEEPVVVKEKKPPEEWCDRIYFNYKCYAGPSISRNKLSQLPKHVGPGPLSLVLKEVLNKIISASYKPAKLLKDWETEGPPEEGMRLEMLRAKLKSSTYHAYVAVAGSAARVRAFCAAACARLHACPALFGPDDYPLACPHRCRTVDKAIFHNGTERRGRPKGMIGRRKKRKGNPDKRDKELPAPEHEAKDESVESDCSPPSPRTRPSSPDCDKPARPHAPTRAKPHYALHAKRAPWDKKDQNVYSSTAKRTSPYSDTENDSSTNSRDKNISDVSDGEEPELKKLKFSTYEEQPSDNPFERDAAAWTHKLKLAPNPLDWSVDDVHAYLRSTDDCRLVADRMRQEEIDGQAFLMLDGAAIREFLHMKQEFALAVTKHIDMMRWHTLHIDDSCQI